MIDKLLNNSLGYVKIPIENKNKEKERFYLVHKEETVSNIKEHR